MALEYKIEWFRNEKQPNPELAKEGAFIHLTKELTCFQEILTKEEYTLVKCQVAAILEENPEAFDAEAECSQICELVDKLFDVEGVVEVSLKAYEVYIVKAPLFNWDDIIESVLNILLDELDETELFEKLGSRSEIRQFGSVGDNFLGF